VERVYSVVDCDMREEEKSGGGGSWSKGACWDIVRFRMCAGSYVKPTRWMRVRELKGSRSVCRAVARCIVIPASARAATAWKTT